MKIISYYIKGNNIYIKTDNEDMPNFTYPINRFDDINKLKKEIEKKIKLTKQKKEKKDMKLNKLKEDLSKEVNK